MIIFLSILGYLVIALLFGMLLELNNKLEWVTVFDLDFMNLNNEYYLVVCLLWILVVPAFILCFGVNKLYTSLLSYFELIKKVKDE